jgi:nitric oxide reductase NorE protein
MTSAPSAARAGSLPHEPGERAAPGERARGGRFVPGQPDMWAFVLFEALVFTSYFTVYVIRRTQSPEAFLQSQAHLDLRVGVFNTLVLLVSSWSVARCVQAAREGSFRAALSNAYLTMLFGFVFLVSKVLEWVTEVDEGFTFTTDEFFSFYYFLTAIHFLHLLIGFVVLGIAVHQIRSPARRSQEAIETCATYWHTIDFLWVLIFALLYVMR